MIGNGGSSSTRATVKGLAWQCTTCGDECVPIRPESRCMCGHRLKEHKQAAGGESHAFRCTKDTSCPCPSFFYIVAEGSWILRCRCKHKHTDHDPWTHKCTKSGCECAKFDSPWVCNCNHPWAAHEQVLVERQVLTLAGMVARAKEAAGDGPAGQAAEAAGFGSGAAMVEQPAEFAPEVNRWDLLKRGE